MDLIGTHYARALAEAHGRVLRVICREQGSQIPLGNVLAYLRHVDIVSQRLSLIDSCVPLLAMLSGHPTGRNGHGHGGRFRHLNSPHTEGSVFMHAIFYAMVPLRRPQALRYASERPGYLRTRLSPSNLPHRIRAACGVPVRSGPRDRHTRRLRWR